MYEPRGLIEPERSTGPTRRYSDDDIALLRHIAGLTDRGLNIAGVSVVLELEAINRQLRAELAYTADAQQAEPTLNKSSIRKEQRP